MRPDSEVIETGALIIGAGAAGLRTAIELTVRGVPCLVVGRRRHGDAHTRMAAGGINAVLGTRDPEDRWPIHFADTVREGHFVCDPAAVELLCRHAPERVRELRAWGCDFSETADGEIDQRYFGAQSYRRTCFAADRTGEAVLATLVDRARAVGVPYREGIFVTGLLVAGGGARGALGVRMDDGAHVVLRADAVVLAAGGLTSIYGRGSSRHDENNGDAVALAYQAGAVLRDMEFVQFHPTGMIEPPALRGRLVTEAVRGEGGRLFNAAGERFMERYSPEKMELDARDVVARAIEREIRAGRGTPRGAVLLDISHQDAAFVRERLPKLVAQLAEQGVDMTREPIEVAPTAHYAMGGVRVDFATGATDVPGLFAVGEATGGVHGANRLGGNSLAETVVFGAITGEAVAGRLAAGGGRGLTSALRTAAVDHFAALAPRGRGDDGADPDTLGEEVGALLREHGAIMRSGDGLREAVARLTDLARRAEHCAGGDTAAPRFFRALELRATLRAAEAVLRSALLREESRGAHYRSDAPDEDDQWRRTVLCSAGEHGRMRLWSEPVPPVPPALQRVVDEGHTLDYHHLE